LNNVDYKEDYMSACGRAHRPNPSDQLAETYAPEGQKLKAARQRCFDALDGKASAADARSAFIEAAREADIFVDYVKK
jgi:hypothetical protein